MGIKRCFPGAKAQIWRLFVMLTNSLAANNLGSKLIFHAVNFARVVI